MPRFTYTAYTEAGGRTTGVIDADSRETALSSLFREGKYPLELTEGAAAGGERWWQRDIFGGPRLSQRNLALLTRELATLLKAELPVDETLRIIALQPLMGARARHVVKAVLDGVMGGASLSEAMAAQQGMFPEFYWRIVQAGEQAGTLARSLEELAVFLERSTEFRAKIASALLYPVILLVAAGIALMVILTVLIPTIAPLFKEAGAQPPVVMQVLIAIEEAILAHWPFMLLLGGLCAVGLVVLSRDDRWRMARDRWLLRLPIVAALIQNEQTATFSRTLGTLLHNSVPMLQALAVSGNVLSNRAMAAAVRSATNDMKEGATLVGPLGKSGYFPELSLRLIAVGEQTGQLDVMLTRVADIYETTVQRQLLRLTSLLTPILTLVFGIMVGGLLLSVMGAIVSLNDLAFK